MDRQLDQQPSIRGDRPWRSLYSVRPQIDSKLGHNSLNTCLMRLTEQRSTRAVQQLSHWMGRDSVPMGVFVHSNESIVISKNPG